jgi:lipopolysaccharide assembly outer membrane protein LptD (OstA)
MIKTRSISILLTSCLFSLFLIDRGLAQEADIRWEIESLTDSGGFVFDSVTQVATGTNGLVVKYGSSTLTADRVTVNQLTGDATATGNFRIERDQMVWAGESVEYNFKTRLMRSENFRVGSPPAFAGGAWASGDGSNNVYTATNAFVTTDDVAEPALKIRAKKLIIVPEQYFEAHSAVVYLGDVPVMYYPYYRRSLARDANHFYFTPGYRSRFGPFLLGRYDWILNEQLDGSLHADWREKRGFGLGPDVNWHLGRWGEGSLRYYYADDNDPGRDPDSRRPIPDNRQRFYLEHFMEVDTNFTVKGVVRYQSDPWIVRDFMEGEFKQNVQPSTFLEAQKTWDNWNLNTYAQPRLIDDFNMVERLPDVKFTGYRQKLGVSPVYLESENSFGWFQQKFADTNHVATPYSAWRADTFQQLLWPQRYFGWLNVTPRVGGRLTAYGEADGPSTTTDQENRFLFNTGVEISFKASRLWPQASSRWLDVDGLRHVIEPSFNYAYIPTPNVKPKDLPQFDYAMPAFRLQPIDLPDYNNLDQLDSANTLRLGLRNRFTTKREGELDTLASWALYTDWRLGHRHGNSTFSDVYSDMLFKPRSWVTLSSVNRYDVEASVWRLAYHNLTLQPARHWSWGFSHFYLNDGPVLGQGNNLFANTFYYRLSENWAARTIHRFEASDGRLEEQFYTVYRDLRSWTAALTLRIHEPENGSTDVSVVFTFSLKAAPRFNVGDDSFRPSYLLGG